MVQVSKLSSQAKLRVERARASSSFFDILIRTFKRYSEDDGGFYAASLTYYAFFAIFPLLLFSAAALGYVTFLNAGLREDILKAGFEAFPLLDSAINPENLTQIEEARGRLALLAVVLALYSGSGGIVALEHALNHVAHVTEEPGFVPKRLRSIKWLLILGGTAIVSVALGAAATYTGVLLGSGGLADRFAAILGHVIGIATGIVLFATAFKYLTAAQQSWRQVLPGALIAGSAFELLKIAGTLYLDRGEAGREATFGAFAAAAGLLVVAYLLSQITLLSAEVNAVLCERRETRKLSIETDETGSEGG
jgi:inner membrane protein YhjD